jgi:hypothetical protein
MSRSTNSGHMKKFILLCTAQAFIFQPLAIAGPKDTPKISNECWTSPDGKETCDHPKTTASSGQFTFKDGNSTDKLKMTYEEKNDPDQGYFPQAALKAARETEVRELHRVEAAEKETCDHPKTTASSGQFTFKDGNSTDKLKMTYEEKNDPDQGYFPQAALKAARETEVRELHRVEAAEKETIANRDAIENKKIEAMQEIQKHKFEMADHKFKQEKMSEEMDIIQNELVKIQGQQADLAVQSKELDAKVSVVTEKHQDAANNLHASQQKLAVEAETLNKKRVETEKKVSKMQIEMQQSIAQIAKDQSLIARAESEKVQYETQEIHVANQLTSLLERRKEIADEREKASLEIGQLQKRLDSVKDDYKVAKSENDALEREVKSLTAKLSKDRVNTATEIQDLERKILVAKDSKFKNDYERARLVAESEKMKTQLIDVQKRYDQAAVDETASSLAVMESRVDVETAKTDVSTKESGIEDLKYHGKKQRDQIRNLASLAESSQMLETQQKAKVVKACKVLTKPENSSESVGRLKKGSIIVAAPAAQGFYKVLNSSGSPQFVYQTCIEVVE